MVCVDEDALICDFAETYGVYDYRSLPILTAATLAQGLNPNSRIMRTLSGMELPINTLLLATAVDRLSYLVWMNTKDGFKNRNRPDSILRILLHHKAEKTAGFENAEDFRTAWKRMTQEDGVECGN